MALIGNTSQFRPHRPTISSWRIAGEVDQRQPDARAAAEPNPGTSADLCELNSSADDDALNECAIGRKVAIFSSFDIEHFIREGYVMLREAFPSAVADLCREVVWDRLDVSADEPEGWSETMIHIQDVFYKAPSNKIMNDRIRDAAGELAGPGRANVLPYYGWWPVLFPGFEGPGGWHVDGSNFQHRLRSKEQALVTLFLFSDIDEGDGGTAIARGSHYAVAKILEAAEPEGLENQSLIDRLPNVEPSQIAEVQGKAGDIAFLHPFLVHGFSANKGSKVRFACNPQYALHEEMNLDRSDHDYSPVEEAIRRGLGRSKG